jgi:hypothetical protein
MNSYRDRYINDLLNKAITEFYVGYERLKYTDLLHEIGDGLISYKFLLPKYILGGRFLLHAKAFFKLYGENNYGIIVEYGGKPKGNNYLPDPNDRDNPDFFKLFYIYGNEGGLRYQISTIENFKANCSDYMKPYIGLTYSITTNQLLRQIYSEKSWRRKDYDLKNHNCQDFIAKIIEKLRAKRRINCIHDGRGYHNFSLAYFPPVIINEFEKNENDSDLKINKFPIIGQLEEGVRIIGEEIFNLLLRKK